FEPADHYNSGPPAHCLANPSRDSTRERPGACHGYQALLCDGPTASGGRQWCGRRARGAARPRVGRWRWAARRPGARRRGWRGDPIRALLRATGAAERAAVGPDAGGAAEGLELYGRPQAAAQALLRGRRVPADRHHLTWTAARLRRRTPGPLRSTAAICLGLPRAAAARAPHKSC
ncbi:MAG: hypothetical protein J3K34DRAFT_527435, partial [Monoraphidium minutum]